MTQDFGLWTSDSYTPPMPSPWSESAARRFVRRYGRSAGRDAALCLYASRLLGSDPSLVLHGGGNTSVKTTAPDVSGRRIEILRVKGSGADLATLEPGGLPAAALEPLRRLRTLPALPDESMVNELRRALLDASAPTPSVEALLHAFLPARFVLHTHADAVLTLTNQPRARALLVEALGDGVPILPWIMPGFPLAKAVAKAAERNPEARTIVLLNHGLFTFSDDAREAYESHVRLAERCARLVRRRVPGASFGPIRPSAPPAGACALAAGAAPILRGALAGPAAGPGGAPRRVILDWRASREGLSFLERPDAARLASAGPLTPDHVIRTKSAYLLAPAFDPRRPEAFRAAVSGAVMRYRAAYERGFRSACRARDVRREMLDPSPRVVLVPGAGLFASGRTVSEARIAADIAERTLRAKAIAEDLGRYRPLSALDLFDMEYWSLEQAKIRKGPRPPLEGQAAIVTGAAGAIGAAVARSLAEAGASVALADLDGRALAADAAWIESRRGKGSAVAIRMDVSDTASVRAGFDAACLAFGGVDIVVPNAGLAAVGRLERLDPADFDRLLAVNARGTFLVLAETARRLRAQGTGGSIVIVSTKNVLAPGASFGAYSASKAAAHQLGRIAALELADIGVRVNLVAPDAVFGGAGRRSGLWAAVGPDRARSKGLSPEGLERHYRERSLLKVPVAGEDVGRAVVFFASNATPTTGAVLPVDAGVPEAFPR